MTRQISESCGEVTKYGFTWGPLAVNRLAVLPEGRHVLEVKTERRAVDVYVSRTGLIRVFSEGKELKIPHDQHQ